MRRLQPPETGRRRLLVQLLAVGLLGVGLLLVGAVSGLAAAPTIEVTGNSLATYAWTPSTADIESGGTVSFKNPTANFHGLVWETGDPEAPSCTGTPSVGQGNWSGSCTFAQGGTYAFYCPVHPAQMRGTVTVSGPAAPVVFTGSASALSESEATLNGTVNPSEQEASYFFEYGTSVGYGQKTAESSAGNGSAPVSKSATVTSLTPGTTYHFRLVAKNATGTSHGLDRTFRTTGGSEPPPIEPPPPVEPAPLTPSVAPVAVSPSPPPAAVLPPAPPDTKITLKPRAKTTDRTPTFKFTATVPGATFRCSIDGKPAKLCRSPFTTPPLKSGRHTIRVAAVTSGSTDPTPASASFKVLPKRKLR